MAKIRYAEYTKLWETAATQAKLFRSVEIKLISREGGGSDVTQTNVIVFAMESFRNEGKTIFLAENSKVPRKFQLFVI